MLSVSSALGAIARSLDGQSEVDTELNAETARHSQNSIVREGETHSMPKYLQGGSNACGTT